MVLCVDVEFDRLVGRLEPRPVNLEVNWPVVRLLDDVELYAERLCHCSAVVSKEANRRCERTVAAVRSCAEYL